MTAELMPLPPGVERSMRALDAHDKAMAKQEEDERATAAEERHDRLIALRMAEAWARGEPFDPMNPGSLARSVEEMAAEAFRSDDQPEMTITAPVSTLVAADLVTRLDAGPEPARQASRWSRRRPTGTPPSGLRRSTLRRSGSASGSRPVARLSRGRRGGDRMTAGKAENAAAQQAVAAGEAFAAGLAATSQREAAATNGSDMATSQASLEGPAAVTWPSPSSAGQPPAVSPRPSSSPNVDRPTDNSQSQP